eukprot:2157061-Pleurochrysis_carterae.AAC.1
MGGMIVDEPRCIEARLTVHSPCDISSSFMPNLQTPIMIILAVRLVRIADMAIPFMASRIGRINGRRVERVLSYFLCAKRTHYEHPFNPAVHYSLLDGGSDWTI